MMGVRRSTVTEVASELQKNGLISYVRGRIHIKDIEPIWERACECDGDIQSHYRRIFHSNEADVAPSRRQTSRPSGCTPNKKPGKAASGLRPGRVFVMVTVCLAPFTMSGSRTIVTGTPFASGADLA